MAFLPLPLPPSITDLLPPSADDQIPRILTGPSAGLSNLRNNKDELDQLRQRTTPATVEDAAAADGPDESYTGPSTCPHDATVSKEETERNEGGSKRPRDGISTDTDPDDDDGEGLLLYLPTATVALLGSREDDENDNNSSPNGPSAGLLIVTNRRILFLGSKLSSEEDLNINAACVTLHALSSDSDDGGWHVYCQLDGDGADVDEALFYANSPSVEVDGGNGDSTNTDDSDPRAQCQILFDAFTRLANLNPIYEADTDEQGGGGFFPFGLVSGMGVDHADDDDDSGMICRLGDGIVAGGDDGPAATDEERQTMLQRLDGMLVVPTEYEIGSDDGTDGECGGQFDDASGNDNDDEDEDLL